MQIIENASSKQVADYLHRNSSYCMVPTTSDKLDVFNAGVGEYIVSRQFARCVGVVVPGQQESLMFHISEYILSSNGADRRDIAKVRLEFNNFTGGQQVERPIAFGGFKPNVMSLEYNRIIKAIGKVLGIPVQIVSSPKTMPDEVEDAYWDGKTQTLLLAKRKWND